MAKVKDAARKGTGGTCKGVAAATVADDFASLAVLLVIKRDGAVGGARQIAERAGMKIEASGSNEEGDVAHPKGCGVGGEAMFAGTKHKEEAEPCEVDNGGGERTG